MKKLSTFFVAVFLLVLSFKASSQTQTPKDYFVGKWDVLVEGTPNGDSKMLVNLERKDGKLAGTITIRESNEPLVITNIEESEKSVTLYFNASGHDVFLQLEKKDDDHVAGNAMNMFDAKGVRVKS